MFPISQVYEGLLQKMGEKNNDGGQFFTPREVIRVIVKVIDPYLKQELFMAEKKKILFIQLPWQISFFRG